MPNEVIWNQIRVKHPARKKKISENLYSFKPDEEFQLKLEKILPKLNMNAAPGSAGLRNSHLRPWVGVYAPPAADEAVEHLELLISDMANDKLPPWFMQAVQGEDLISFAKVEACGAAVGDHRPVHIPNTLSKIEDMAVLHHTQGGYTSVMMPQQLGVGVKFAAELLAMGIRMTLNLHRNHILVTIDFENAFNEMQRAAVLERHRQHAKLNMMVPYRRAKLGPRS